MKATTQQRSEEWITLPGLDRELGRVGSPCVHCISGEETIQKIRVWGGLERPEQLNKKKGEGKYDHLGRSSREKQSERENRSNKG